MTDRELMQMALDAMESFESGTNGLYKGEFAEERKALRNRLSQPERVHAIDISQERVDETAKDRHEWIGLTHEERDDIDQFQARLMEALFDIEAKLKEKNGG